MDTIVQFYAEVRIHQMLSFLTYCHANNFDNIPFIDGDILVYTAVQKLIPQNAIKSIKRIADIIRSHKVKKIGEIPTQQTIKEVKTYSIYFNESLNPEKGDQDANKKRSLITEISEAKKKKK